MEWYAITMCKSSLQSASFLGAVQLIVIAAIWVFDFALPRPQKKD